MAPRGPPYGIPDGFPDLLQKFVVHILKHQPDDIVKCAVGYFTDLHNQANLNGQQSMKVGTSNVMSYIDDTAHKQMSECLIAASQQKVSVDAREVQSPQNNYKSGIFKRKSSIINII